MAAQNQVTLTFAGDSEKLERAFDQVGAAARSMGDDVQAAGAGFDRAGEAADAVDTKAMGFRDTLTGLQDGFAGIKAVNEGGLGFESLLLLGFGVGDLASGMFNFLIPSLKSTVLWLGNTKVGMMATAAWAKVAAAAQWLWNIAMSANPIALVVIAIVALVAVIVLIATKTTWFQDLWKVAWTNIKKWAVGFWEWIRELPGMLGRAFVNLVNIITTPWRTAFNLIARMWNNTVGGLSFQLPSWVPGIGGRGFDMPDIPTFHRGGVMPGAPGSEGLALLQAGEVVTPAGATGRGLALSVEAGSGTTAEQMLASLILHLFRTGALRLVVRDGRVSVA